MNEVIRVHVNGKTIDCTPCSKKHAAYFEGGYLVPSCRKCVLAVIDPEVNA